MAVSAGGLCVLGLDVLLRRLLFPIVLLSAVIFRYNLLSLVYLLLLIVCLYLPGPQLKSQRFSSAVYYIVVLLFSGLASVGQALFQISIATEPPQDPNAYFCSGAESTWRQIGFVRFNIPPEHVVRLLLPDVIVFLGSLVTLCVNLYAVRLCRSGRVGGGEGVSGGVGEGTEETNDLEENEAKPTGIKEMGSVLTIKDPPFPATVQCYYQLPRAANYLLDLLVFVLLMLSGVAVPSISAYSYYIVFLVILVLWSLHLKLKMVVRCLKVVVMLYAALHLVVLDLYQFQSGQELVKFEPLNSSLSLVARLFGLTPVILTDCQAPYELALHPQVHYTRFLSPAFILCLLMILSTEFRLWLFTPTLLWRMYGVYCLPVHDQTPSNQIHCLSKQGPLKRKGVWSSYGATREATSEDTAQLDPSTVPPEGDPPRKKGRRRKITWEGLWRQTVHFGVLMWSLYLRISFVLSIVAMMAWSVLYPSWPALVLLLWTCGIWLIPKINPRDSLFYTSPVLVLYALVLIHIQYVYSLDLTKGELNRDLELGEECPRDTDFGCRTWVLLVKTLFTIVFFTSFHEFMVIVKEKFRDGRGSAQGHTLNDADGRESPSEEDVETAAARSKVYQSLFRILATYWILAVLGAFLLVTLAGPPTLLKTVYLGFLFLFMITYQVTEKFWFYFSFIVWWLLILYAAVDLVLIYTYQFDVVSDGWESLYNSSSLPSRNISGQDLFNTIGLIKFDNDFASLIVSLIPPAVFIAVLAMQLRYFTPKSPLAARLEEEATAVDLVSLFPRFVRNAVQRLKDEGADEEEGNDDKRTEHAMEDLIVLSTATREKSMRRSVQRQSTTESLVSSSTHQTKLQSCYRFMLYSFRKTRQLLVELLNLFWRFLELHLHKVVGLTVFAVSITQVSVIYWFLLLFLLLVLPMPVLNFLSYPILTLFLGAVSISKMVYQTPLIKVSYLNFVYEENACDAEIVTSDRGLEFNHTYSPVTSDAAWIGLHKAANFADYIALPIIASLFMTLWFSARRYQTNYYRSQGIKVEPYERGSLFLGVTKRQADRSILSSLKYLINHFFEMYGVEVCWAMLSITVAVRIDVYGVVYALLLGILLVLPRPILPPVWLLYLFLHGVLLLVQYFFLLGAPAGICYTHTHANSTVYPWSSFNVEGMYTPLKKWLFLSGDRVQILDRSLLYADFLVFLLAALQLRYFTRNPVEQGSPEQVNGVIVNFYKLNYWVDYIKVLVFQYSFWFSLFLMFLTAATRVSLFGLLYLLLGLFFLYRGQDMLRDRQRNRRRSWAFLRLVTWAILLLRVSLQILDCAVLGAGKNDYCVVLLLFNAVCSKSQYYGSAYLDCPTGSSSVGLWVDALNFIVMTIQIIVFDSQFSEQVKTELERKEGNATFFRDVFDAKIKEQRNVSKELSEREQQELKERSAHLTETQNVVDHVLYVGVRVPDELELRSMMVKPKAGSDDTESQVGGADTVSIISEDPQSKRSDSPSEASDMETSDLVRTWDLVKGFLLKLVDGFIDFLERSSVIYRSVVAEINRDQTPPITDEAQPLAHEETNTYGSTEASPVPESKKMDVPVEIHVHVRSGEEEEEKKEKKPATEVDKQDDGATGGPSKSVVFDIRGDTFVTELRLAPNEREREMIESYEDDFEDQVRRYSTRPRRLLTALYYMFLSHSDYLVFFLLILNIILNGSILSLMYAFLLFSWGLLSIPWPTKRFWISLILYTMLVLIVKYGFQFYDLDTVFWSKRFDNSTGLYPPRIIGILHRENFLANAVWDVLLLISILFHRSLLRQYGLWRSSKRPAVSSIFVMLWRSTVKFFKRLVNPDISQGTRDYYPSMLFFDLLCFLTIVFGVNSFGVGVVPSNSVAIADFIRTNYVPLPFVIMLLLQFLSMLADRAIYLRHSVKAKLVLQVVLLLAWHIWLFIVLPSDAVNRRPFTENAAAQCIYFFKCCYFIVSSLQIVSGYPVRVIRNLLTSSFDIFTWLAFLVYRLVPLLPELRQVMDWVFTDTALSLINWLKVQEIYAQLFLVKVQRERELDFPRFLGEKQSWFTKILLGGLLLTALVLLIWGPLLVMSVISSNGQSNEPTEVSIRLTLSGYEPLVHMTAPQQSVNVFNTTEYLRFRSLFDNTAVFPVFGQEYFQSDFSRVSFPGVSSTIWAISPPSRQMLVRDLRNTLTNPNVSVPLEFYWSITRQPLSDQASETVSGFHIRPLTMATDNATILCLLDALGDMESSCRDDGVIELNGLYPSIIHAPANKGSSNFTTLSDFLKPPSGSVSCQISLQSNAQLINTSYERPFEWWELKCAHDFSSLSNSSLDLYIYSERIALSIFSGIASIGIIGLYLSVVLVIGRFIRTYISDLPTRLYIDEILNPDPLIKLCHDIFLVRETKDFQMEEILVGKLFYIFKSPEKVARATRQKPKIKTD